MHHDPETAVFILLQLNEVVPHLSTDLDMPSLRAGRPVTSMGIRPVSSLTRLRLGDGKTHWNRLHLIHHVLDETGTSAFLRISRHILQTKAAAANIYTYCIGDNHIFVGSTTNRHPKTGMAVGHERPCLNTTAGWIDLWLA